MYLFKCFDSIFLLDYVRCAVLSAWPVRVFIDDIEFMLVTVRALRRLKGNRARYCIVSCSNKAYRSNWSNWMQVIGA